MNWITLEVACRELSVNRQQLTRAINSCDVKCWPVVGADGLAITYLVRPHDVEELFVRLDERRTNAARLREARAADRLEREARWEAGRETREARRAERAKLAAVRLRRKEREAAGSEELRGFWRYQRKPTGWDD